MILFIVTQDKEGKDKAVFWKMKNTIGNIAEDLCVDVHYSDLSRELVEQFNPWAVVHSGANNPYGEYDILEHAGYLWTVKEYPAAQLAICRGHQLVADAFGGKVDVMRALNDDDPDLMPDWQPGFFKARGVYPVKPLRQDPVFEGLGGNMRFVFAHLNEVKELPDNFELLATSRHCRVQVYKHKEKPVYGCQFHPEFATDDYPDGRGFLKNFFNIARCHSGLAQR